MSEPTTNAPEAPADPPRRGLLGRFFGDFRTKLWTAIIALLVGGSIGYGAEVMGWIGDRFQAAMRGFVEEVARETLRADAAGESDDPILPAAIDARIDAALQEDGLIGEAFNTRSDEAIAERIELALQEGGEISNEIVGRIEEALQARVGTAIAGELRLNRDEPSRTLRFYVPADHEVDLTVKVKGLRNSEVIRMVAHGPEGNDREITIDEDKTIDFQGLRRDESGRGESASALLGEEVRGRISNILHVTMTLAAPEVLLAASVEGIAARPELQSAARIEFVALLTPPLKRVHD